MKRFAFILILAAVIFIGFLGGSERAAALQQPSSEQVSSLLANILDWFRSVDSKFSDAIKFSNVYDFLTSSFAFMANMFRELADIFDWIGEKASQYAAILSKWWVF